LAEARPLAERALTITETAYGSDHPDVAIRLSNLGIILRDLGQLAEARPLAERALAITETAYGPDHPAVAARRTNLAVILADLDQRRGIKRSPATSEVSGTEQQRGWMEGNADDST
jgi:tetratricopeptide (TPR) repeat protein